MNKLLAILFILINTSLLSQNNEGEIEDAQIIIQKNSKIILNNVDKNIEKIQLESNPFKKKSIEFNDFEYKIINSDKKIDKFLRNEGITFYDERNTTINLMGGNYNSFLANINPSMIDFKKLTLNSDLFFNYNGKGLKFKDFSKKTIVDSNINFNYSINSKNLISSNFNFAALRSGYYGLIIPDNYFDLNRKNILISNNTFSYDVKWERSSKNYKSKLNFIGKNFNDKLYNEGNILFNGNFTVFNEKSIFSFNPYFNFYTLSAKINNGFNNLDLGLIKLPIQYNYMSNNFSVSLNGKYIIYSRNWKNKDTGSGIYPSLKFKYHTGDLSISILASRDINNEVYSEEISNLPYIYDPFLFSEFNFIKEKYRIKSKINYHLNDNLNIGVSYQTQKADGNLDYILYTGNYFPVDIGYPIFLYSVTRDYELERIDILSVSINSTHNNISASLDFTYNIYEENEVFMPIYIVEFLSTFNYEKLNISLGMDMELKTYGLNLSNEIFEMNPFVDVYIHSSYKLSDNVSIRLDMNNILNRYNERYFMYPELGYNLLTGIRWIF